MGNWPRVPAHTTRNLNDPPGLRFLEKCEPDLIVSAFFDQRLRQEALAIPRFGCVNIHPSLLPALRGVDPVLQARIRGAERIERRDPGAAQPSGGSYQSWPSREEIRALRVGGGRLVRAGDFRQA